MLAPSTHEALRRPSSTSDFILSGSDSRSVRCNTSAGERADHYQCAHLSPSASIHSAPLSASPSACWTGAAAAAGSPDCSRSSTPTASPEARKRYWCRRLMKLKDDMDRFGDGFRRSVRGTIDTLATRLSPSVSRRRRCRNNGGGVERLRGRGISVHIVRDQRVDARRPDQRSKSADRSRSRSVACRLDELAAAAGDGSYKLPSALTVTALHDGAFSGEIPLHSAGSVTVRIRDYRLEFYDDAAPPQFVGSVSLPIYVDPASVQFQLQSSDAEVDGTHLLRVDGRMKGCGTAVGDAGHGRRRRRIATAQHVGQRLAPDEINELVSSSRSATTSDQSLHCGLALSASTTST